MNNLARHIEILLVEDDPGSSRLSEMVIDKALPSYGLNFAKDAEEALSYLRREGSHANAITPDLILLDIRLPKMNGFELLKIIKNDAKLAHIPVIMLTLSVYKEDMQHSYDLEANAYITKPIDIGQFMALIQSLDEFKTPNPV